MSAPLVITSEDLSQREARPVVLVSPEEILRMRTASFSKSITELGFLVRQPSAAAIMSSYVELELVCRFRFSVATAVPTNVVPITGLAAADNSVLKCPEGLPIQSKCIRTAVVSINGASQTYRCSEFVLEYLKMHASRDYMEKIGYGWDEQGAADPQGNATFKKYQAFIKNQLTRNQTADFASAAVDGGGQWTQEVVFREPLVIGPFGALNHMDAYPSWSCEGAKSPSLLHCDQMQISLSMLDNWYKNLMLMIRNHANNAGTVDSVKVVGAYLNTEFYTPPPKMVASSLSQAVRYATWSALRFKLEDTSNGNFGAAGIVAPGGPLKFDLRACTFPYMPNCFIFSIQPLYEHKNASFCANGAVAAQVPQAHLKLDKRLTITHMDLQINASSSCMPHVGGSDVATATGLVTVRLNARALYKCYLKNSASWESAVYSFEEWMQGGCQVCLTSSDLNGITSSPSIRGQVTISGTVHGVNNTRTAVYVGDTHSAAALYRIGAANGGVNIAAPMADQVVENYQACCIGVYSNKVMQLDAKSGMVSEQVFSQQLGEQLRLSNSAQ